MSDSGYPYHRPPEYSAGVDPGNPLVSLPVPGSGNPLTNLSVVRSRMDSLHRFLVDSVNQNTLLPKHQMEMVNSELVSAIHQVFVNGAALLTLYQPPPTRPDPGPDPGPVSPTPVEPEAVEPEEDYEILELDAVELLAEHIHLCEICGKGFKRDANLRMHMRAHGNQFKTPEALARPDKAHVVAGDSDQISGTGGRKTRFSCPYGGCNRNQHHRNFRPLKSVICVKNHFKRSHCPKMYTCNRCHKKSFSVLADLKSHLKHCGDAKWKCSCGATFSRKDKLFGHVALFEGHMPAMGVADIEVDGRNTAAPMEEVEEDVGSTTADHGVSYSNSFLNLENGMIDDNNQCLEDIMIGSSSSIMEDLFNF